MVRKWPRADHYVVHCVHTRIILNVYVNASQAFILDAHELSMHSSFLMISLTLASKSCKCNIVLNLYHVVVVEYFTSNFNGYHLP